MREKTPEDILHLGHLELLPLLPATQGGASHEIIEMMMEQLLASDPIGGLAYYGYLVVGVSPAPLIGVMASTLDQAA